MLRACSSCSRAIMWIANKCNLLNCINEKFTPLQEYHFSSFKYKFHFNVMIIQLNLLHIFQYLLFLWIFTRMLHMFSNGPRFLEITIYLMSLCISQHIVILELSIYLFILSMTSQRWRFLSPIEFSAKELSIALFLVCWK